MLTWHTEQELDRYFDTALGWLEDLDITPEVYENARKVLEAEYLENRAATAEELEATQAELKKIDTQFQTLNHHLLSGVIKPDAFGEMRDHLSMRKAEFMTRISELETADREFCQLCVR